MSSEEVSANATQAVRLRVLRWWVVVAGVVVLILMTSGATFFLYRLADANNPGQKIEAIKTALTLGLGTGGLAALLLTVRRQWLQELAQLDQRKVSADTKAHQERVAVINELDVTEKRITELYAKSVEQLGSDKAPVRLGGLYALERLAQENVSHRGTIAEVLCAYLRMPYAPPSGVLSKSPEDAERHRVEERHVRVTAQQILARHLRPRCDPDGRATNAHFWENVNLDLAGATLLDLDLSDCSIGRAAFTGASFVGRSSFSGATFRSSADFDLISSESLADFNSVQFCGDVTFAESALSELDMSGAEFLGDADFSRIRCNGPARFSGAGFDGTAEFEYANFGGDTSFVDSRFARSVTMSQVSFSGAADFSRARFAEVAAFGGVRMAGTTRFNNVHFGSLAWFEKAAFEGSTWWDAARFERDAWFRWATFVRDTWFRFTLFEKDLVLVGSVFHRDVVFDNLGLRGEALLDGIYVREDVPGSTIRRWPGARRLSFETTPPEVLRTPEIYGVWGKLASR